jgi:hypothetical protein
VMMCHWVFPEVSMELSSTWNTWPLKMKALCRFETSALAQRNVTSQKTRIPETPLLEPQTRHRPDRLWRPLSRLIQWTPCMHRSNFSFADRVWETETYLCCVYELEEKTHMIL